MAETLRGLQGRFILSINDVPEVRATFAGFRIRPVRTTYSVSRTRLQPKAARGLIITSGGLVN